MITSQVSENSEVAETKKAIARDRRWFGVGVLFFGLIVVGVMGVGYVLKTQNTQIVEQSESQIDQISRQPVDSAKPAVVDPQSYSVKILNGSGVTGAAAAIAKELGDRNQELVITTGNAKLQTGTSVSYKSDAIRRSSLARIIEELYPEIMAKVGEQIEDVIITIGK